jgi:hypothetical protein
MRFLQRLSVVQLVIMGVLIVSLLGIVGSIIWNYPAEIFLILGGIAGIVNFLLMSRAGLRQPVPGRPELDPSQEQGPRP